MAPQLFNGFRCSWMRHWLTNYTSAVVFIRLWIHHSLWVLKQTPRMDIEKIKEPTNEFSSVTIALHAISSINVLPTWPMNVWSAMGLHLTSLSESRITLQRLLSKWRRQNDRYHFDTRLLKRSASIEMVARDVRCKFQVLIKNNSGQCICIVTKQIKWLERHARVSTVSLFDLACYNSDNLFHCIGNSVVFFHRLRHTMVMMIAQPNECVSIKRNVFVWLRFFPSTCVFQWFRWCVVSTD